MSRYLECAGEILLSTVAKAADRATLSLAEFIRRVRHRELPHAVIAEAKRLTLDVIGNAIGGLRTRLGKVALRYVERAGGGGDATVIGSNTRTSVPMAAYANARLGDALDASDTFMSVHHLGVPTVCAALSLAEVANLSGQAFLTAVAVGMEVGARIGAAGGPPSHRHCPQAGEPPNIRSGRLPAEELAAAAASAKLLDLGIDAVRSALGTAGANAPHHATRWGVLAELPDQKYQDYGVVAQTGVEAAVMAACGMTTHPSLLDGDWGLWRLYGAPGCDFALMLADLGERWFFLNGTYKPWPSCRWTHHTLTLFEKLRAEHDLEPSQIERVVVYSHVYGTAPYFCNQEPRGIVSCEFNHPHAVAMLAFRVPPGPWWYCQSVRHDPAIVAFRRKVWVELEPKSLDIERWFVDGQIRRLPNRLVIFAHGRRFEAEGDFARGDPFSAETFFTDGDLYQKFLCMGSRQGAADQRWLAQARGISDIVCTLEEQPSIKPLMELLRGDTLGLDAVANREYD